MNVKGYEALQMLYNMDVSAKDESEAKAVALSKSSLLITMAAMLLDPPADDPDRAELVAHIHSLKQVVVQLLEIATTRAGDSISPDAKAAVERLKKMSFIDDLQ